jgi:hypothetical protein
VPAFDHRIIRGWLLLWSLLGIRSVRVWLLCTALLLFRLQRPRVLDVLRLALLQHGPPDHVPSFDFDLADGSRARGRSSSADGTAAARAESGQPDSGEPDARHSSSGRSAHDQPDAAGCSNTLERDPSRSSGYAVRRRQQRRIPHVASARVIAFDSPRTPLSVIGVQ